MDATTWTVIGMGATILIAIAAQSRHQGRGIGHLRDRMDALRDRMNAPAKEIGEQLAQLREGLAKLEGLREAITGHRAAWTTTAAGAASHTLPRSC